MRILLTAAGLAMLAGCAVLTAPAPLFSAADRDPSFALEEGLWAFRGNDCRVDPARAAPNRKSCLDWARIRRLEDGGWIAEPAEPEDAGDAPARFDVYPATVAAPGVRTPVYVAEGRTDKDEGVNYAALIPRAGPADGDADNRPGAVRRVVIIALECTTITREGPIADIIVEHKDGSISGCTAKTKDAVREAARRAVVAGAATLGDEEIVWVRR
jgi:hypothetical protein